MALTPVQFVRTPDGYNLAYAVRGTGTPFVFMLGSWGNLEFRSTRIEPLLDALASRFQLIQYDSRGQGASTRGLHDDLSIQDYELDLHTVLQRLNVERCILYAQSTFTHVAIRYAATHPERILALILWNPSDNLHGWQAESLREFARADWDAFVVTASRIGFWLMGVDVVLPIMQKTITQADWLKMMKAVGESDALERLAEVRAPTLVLLAPTRQPVVSENATRRVAAEVPNARLAVLEDGVGGMLSVDGQTPGMIPIIDEFLGELAWRTEPAGVYPATPLSARELEVVRLLAAGKTNSQIAEALVITPNTAAKHVARILAKTGAANRSEATAYAFRHRLV